MSEERLGTHVMAVDGKPSAKPADQPAPRSRMSRVLRITLWIVSLLVLFVIGGLAVLRFQEPPVPQGILTAERDPAAENGYRESGEITPGPAFSISSSTLESQSSKGMTNLQFSSAGDRVMADRIAIFNEDDALVMQCVGLSLYEILRDQQRFDEIVYLPKGERLADGSLLPDLYIDCNLLEWEESQGLTSTDYKAKIRVKMGTQFRSSDNYRASSFDAPIVQLEGTLNLDYSGTEKGYVSGGRRYGQVSRAIAKDIAESLLKRLDDLADEEKRIGPIPASLYPSYTPPPDFAFLQQLGAEKRIDGHRLLSKTEAVWHVSERPFREVASLVKAELEADRWEIEVSGDATPQLRATKGAAKLVCELPTDRSSGVTGGTASEMKPVEPVVISYSLAMDEAGLEAELLQLLETDLDPTVALMFRRFYWSHREAWYDYLEDSQIRDVGALVAVAEWLVDGDADKARDLVQRANVLQRIMPNDAYDQSLKKLAEKFQLDQTSTRVSAEVMESIGIVQADTAQSEPHRLTIVQPLIVYLGEEEQRQKWLVVELLDDSADNQEPRLKVSNVALNIQHRGRVSRSWMEVRSRPENNYNVAVESLPAGGEVQVSVETTDEGVVNCWLRRLEG